MQPRAITTPIGGPPDLLRVSRLVWRLIPERIIRERLVFPVALEGGRSGRLLVAMANVADLAAVDEIAFTTGLQVEPVAASPSEIRRAIAVHLDRRAPSAEPVPIDLPDEGESPETSEWLIPLAPGKTRWR